MAMVQVNGSAGLVGYLHDLKIDNDTVLVFQLPRETRMLSDNYIQSAKNAVKEITQNGNKVLFIGSDVNIYSIAGPEAVSLALKGII